MDTKHAGGGRKRKKARHKNKGADKAGRNKRLKKRRGDGTAAPPPSEAASSLTLAREVGRGRADIDGPTISHSLAASPWTSPELELTHHFHTNRLRKALEACVSTYLSKHPRVAPRSAARRTSPAFRSAGTTALPLALSSTKEVLKAALKCVRDEFTKWMFAWLGSQRGEAADGRGFGLPDEGTMRTFALATVKGLLLHLGVEDGTVLGAAVEALAGQLIEVRRSWERQVTSKRRRGAEQRGKGESGAGLAEVQAKESGERMALSFKKLCHNLNRRHYLRLQERFVGEAGDLNAAVFSVVQRYHTLQGGGFQAALPPSVFAVLQRRMGVTQEAFASPLNATLPRYCSLFPDTDGPFGSMGSFFDFRPCEGSYEVNPPFAEETIAAAAAHMTDLLEGAGKRPLSFTIIVPEWRDSPAWQGLAAHPRLSGAPLHVQQRQSYYCEGMQHIRAQRYRRALCDTSVFFLQNEAGRALHSPTPDVREEIAAAFARPEEEPQALLPPSGHPTPVPMRAEKGDSSCGAPESKRGRGQGGAKSAGGEKMSADGQRRGSRPSVKPKRKKNRGGRRKPGGERP